MAQCVSIYDFTDYRKYLSEYYHFEKAHNPVFSYRYFMQKAGYSSCGLYSEIVSGKHNLSLRMIPRFSKALQLNKKESEYLYALVLYQSAKSPEAKQRNFEALRHLLPKEKKRLEYSQKEYYSKWYYVALREALILLDITDEYDELANFIIPALTIEEVEKGIEILTQLHIIHRDSKGYLKPCDAMIVSGAEVGSSSIQKFQSQMIMMGADAIKRFSKKERSVRASSFTVSREGIKDIYEEIDKFHAAVAKIVKTDSNEKQVYQLNVQFFPLSKESINEKEI